MEIKGTSVKVTEKFVIEKFRNRHQEWLNSLPEESLKHFKNGVLIAEWHPMYESVILPTKKIAEVFFNNDYNKAAFEVGYYSATDALNSIYQIFVKIASVDFVMKRATTIFSTYYKSANLSIIENINNENFILAATGFQKGDEEIFIRIVGWIQGMFEIISKNKYLVEFKIEEKSNNFLDCKFYVSKKK